MVKRIHDLFQNLQTVRGPLDLPRYGRVKNKCLACGGDIPKGRHYTCSIGCKIDYKKNLMVVNKRS